MTTTTSTATRPRRVKKRRGPKVDITAMARDYKAGMGIRAVAEEHNVSFGKCHDMLHEAEVTMRPRGGSHPVSVDDETEGDA